MAPKTLHGARAKVAIYDPATGLSKVVGIWNNFSYSINYDVVPVFILGRHTAAELVTTGVEPISIQAQGFRIIDHGAFVEGRLTNVKDLLTQEYLVLTVYDRQTGKAVATVHGCLPTGTSSGASSRQLMEMSNTYLGLLFDDESTQMAEDPTATDLP